MLVVFDLDGTLAIGTHREHFVTGEKKDWPSYFDACDKDSACEPIIEVLHNAIYAGDRVEIWTGRSDVVAEKTKAWLTRFDLDHVRILSRAVGDHTPDIELKEKWLSESDAKPDLVFEDRARVVAMWRSKGIVCCQVAPGEF